MSAVIPLPAPAPRINLSPSIARILLDESPLHAYLQHPRLGGQPFEPSEAMNDGTVIHAMLLGKGGDKIVPIDADSFRTKVAQTARDEAVAARKTPILAHKVAALQRVANVLRDKCASLGYEFTGESEVPFEWEEESEHGQVKCRVKIDHTRLDQRLLIDIKTCESANPRRLGRKIMDLGYDLQQASNIRAVQAKYPDLIGRLDFHFLFVETSPPYDIVPMKLSGAYREIGAHRWHRAVELWQRCLMTDNWPGYYDSAREGGGPLRLEPPPWVLKEQLNGVPDDYED